MATVKKFFRLLTTFGTPGGAVGSGTTLQTGRSRVKGGTCHLHPIHPLHMHVYLTDKFSLYNLKMDNIYGRNI